LKVTEKTIQLIAKMDTTPHVFINASADGFYGMSNSVIYTEDTNTPVNDFLVDVVAKREKAALSAEDLGMRTVRIRFEINLHINNVIDLIYYALTNDNVEGPINATAPNPLRNKDFTAVLGNVLNRPYLFTVPKTIIDLALGEMGQLITRGQYVLPKKAKEYG